MAKSAIAADVHQAFDVRLHFASHRTLDLMVGLDDRPDRRDFIVIQLTDLLAKIDAGLGEDRVSSRAADAENVRQADLCSFVLW